MKRWLCIVLTCMFCLNLIGCTSKEEPSEYPVSEPIMKEQVYDTTFENTNVLSDGYQASVDLSQTNKGYIGARLLNDTQKKVKLRISKDDMTYTYDISTFDMMAYPLQMGDGIYQIKILQNIEGDSYAVLVSQDVQVTLDNEFIEYLYPNQIVNYHKDSKVVDISFDIVKEDQDDLTRVYHLYKYVLDHLDYDKEKAKEVKDIYTLPDLDVAISQEKGICFDYASLLAALCRIQHIPAKVIVGYTDIEYHAWVEIYLEHEGWINPRLTFKGEDWGLVDPTFADSGRDYEGKYDEVYHY